ncbi:MAG TPA: hypothetical protein VKG22_00300 [Stellaceae bacterium]|nr:hypothetical protein [Stellaceae bacterium]HMD65074.1 hypothetical protein [Stellaceae bacterium]
MARRAWRIGLCLYAAIACVDFAYHLIYDVYSSDRGVRYSQLPVAYSAALFWPVDLVAMALLATQLHTESR